MCFEPTFPMLPSSQKPYPLVCCQSVCTRGEHLLFTIFIIIVRVFTFWFDSESIIPGNFGFAISVRERGRMLKSVYVRVFHDLELWRYVLRCVIGRQL